MFYADGKNMEKEWRTLKEQAGHLQWKSYYKDGIRMNEARMKAAIEANYTIPVSYTHRMLTEDI